MLMKLSLAFTFLLAGVAAAHHSGLVSEEQAKSGERVPVIVELFTSEGCSSCPPADQALMRLASTQPVQDVEIIAMSEHVDYWNSLGWTDPFSSAQFTQRQEEYGRAFGLDGSYTPQMVIDGREEFVGNSVSNAVQAISRVAAAAKRPLQLAATNVNGDTVRMQVQIESDPNGGSEDVYLAVTEDNLSSNVKRGENAGRVMPHTAVVRRLTLIGNIDRRNGFHGEPVIRLDRRWKAADLRFVIFVQDRKSRRILAAQAARAQQ